MARTLRLEAPKLLVVRIPRPICIAARLRQHYSADQRLPAWAGRIHTGNAIDWVPSQRYDFVRTGLEYVPLRRRGDLMRHLLDHAVAVDGRLVIGSFSEERPDLLVGERLEEQISSWGFVISGRTERPHHEDERLLYKTLWIDA